MRAPLCSRSRLRLNRGGTLTKPFPVRYQHQLERATFDVEEEYGSIDELDIKVDRLIEVYPSPVSEVVLRQVIPLTPTHRHFMLVFGFWTEWVAEHPGGADLAQREYKFAVDDRTAEYRARKGARRWS